jgi:uncharacterized protein
MAVPSQLALASPTVGGMAGDPGLRAHRLERLRALDRRLLVAAELPGRPGPAPPSPTGSRAAALAAALEGGTTAGPDGTLVVADQRVHLPLDLPALMRLPLDIDPARPLILLDTETTGLATAAGTLPFLVGVGWWEGAVLHVRQLWLPDHAAEPAMLDALEALLPPAACLVTYNGKAFDWPLLVARYRLHRRAPPPLAAHLDLLPLARQLWRHRLPDARLVSVEAGVAGLHRHEDLPGALVPERYFAYLRGGDARLLKAIGRHNHEDVVTMGRLLQVLARELSAGETRRAAHPGDVAALARLLRRRGRRDEALSCYEDALAACERPDAPRAVDAGAVALEHARLLARQGRRPEARARWQALTHRGGEVALHAWLALAKDREHHLRDPAGALAAASEAERLLARRRALGLFMRDLEQDLPRRLGRLRGRLARAQPAAMDATAASVRSTSSAVL